MHIGFNWAGKTQTTSELMTKVTRGSSSAGSTSGLAVLGKLREGAGCPVGLEGWVRLSRWQSNGVDIPQEEAAMPRYFLSQEVAAGKE